MKATKWREMSEDEIRKRLDDPPVEGQVVGLAP